jgi:hypothetical protein
MLAVLGGALTVSEGARTLGLSRPRFQTLLHRGLTGFVTALEMKRPGRPPRPSREVTLAEENARLRRENTRLRGQVAQTGRLLQLASASLTARSQAQSRPRRRAPARRGDAPADPASEPEPDGRREQLTAVGELRARGVSQALAAAVVGRGVRTVQRWTRQVRREEPLVQPPRRAPRPPTAPGLVSRVVSLVRELHGLIGAEALRRAVPGISRRVAAGIKHATVMDLERTRRAAAARIQLTVPGVLRGVDGMQVATAGGPMHLLVAADGCIPYRTSLQPAAQYDSATVADFLAGDFARHGAPLVCRLDRARCHDTPAVQDVLRAHEVLALHGPPHCPRFYGQLERQNREHRGWLQAAGPLEPAALAGFTTQLQAVINARWPRRSLLWQTPDERWRQRPVLPDDRRILREEVIERRTRIQRHLTVHGKPADFTERLAIEQALTARGYLRRVPEGWC